MKAYALGSSSQGNCFVLTFNVGDGRKPATLLVECGFGLNTIIYKMTSHGLRLKDIDAALITHSHKDHSCAASDLAKRGVPIFATKGTLSAIGAPQDHAMGYGIPTCITEGVSALAFKVEHDAPEPAGFVIKTKHETAIFAIDSKRWVDDVTDIKPDYLFIEANYDPKLLEGEQSALRMRGTLDAINRYRLNERIKKSHMSIDMALKTISAMDKQRLKSVFLMHLSDRMSAAYQWKRQVTAITGVPCYVCRKFDGFE